VRDQGIPAFLSSLGRTMLEGPTHTQYSHCFVVLDEFTVMEPWPSGARAIDIDELGGELPVIYAWPRGLAQDEGLQQALTSAARSLDGTPYSHSDYVLWALWLMGVRLRRVRRRLDSPLRMPPARFIVEVYRRAGMDLVAPGDFDVRELSLGDLGSIVLESDWDLRSVVTRW
jgi:hypothetical protein